MRQAWSSGGRRAQSARSGVTISAVVVVLLWTSAGGAWGQDPRLSPTGDGGRAVLALERLIEEAVQRADVEFLDRVCASDFTYTHGDGWTTGDPILGVETKSEWLASLPGRYAARVVDSQQVEVHDDVAITMGRVRAQTGAATTASRTFSFWYVRVYALRDGQWWYLSHRTVHGPVYEE